MVRALRENRVTSWETRVYGLVFLLGWCFTVWIWVVDVYASRALQVAEILSALTITIVSLVTAHQLNQRGDGEHFWKRTFALGFSLILPTTMLAVLASMTFCFILPNVCMTTAVSPMNLALITVLYVVFATWYVWLMYRVSHKQGQ